uniref:Glycoprotein n=1 Tax=Hymenopteran almendra-related virus OKIAV1 TaxID=2746366 RepID=A0A7D7F8E9_9RHAB|nr:glycoprotein [Hymenopteran almendra-related virus OKIAV1]
MTKQIFKMNAITSCIPLLLFVYEVSGRGNCTKIESSGIKELDCSKTVSTGLGWKQCINSELTISTLIPENYIIIEGNEKNCYQRVSTCYTYPFNVRNEKEHKAIKTPCRKDYEIYDDFRPQYDYLDYSCNWNFFSGETTTKTDFVSSYSQSIGKLYLSNYVIEVKGEDLYRVEGDEKLFCNKLLTRCWIPNKADDLKIQSITKPVHIKVKECGNDVVDLYNHKILFQLDKVCTTSYGGIKVYQTLNHFMLTNHTMINDPPFCKDNLMWREFSDLDLIREESISTLEGLIKTLSCEKLKSSGSTNVSEWEALSEVNSQIPRISITYDNEKVIIYRCFGQGTTEFDNLSELEQVITIQQRKVKTMISEIKGLQHGSLVTNFRVNKFNEISYFYIACVMIMFMMIAAICIKIIFVCIRSNSGKNQTRNMFKNNHLGEIGGRRPTTVEGFRLMK